MAHDDPIYVAAGRVIDSGLGSDGSAFTPGRPIWTAGTADDLYHRFVESPDLGSENFITKLSGQLKEAPGETVQLAAELLYLHLLAPIDIGGPAKRTLLTRTLALSPEPIAIPAELDAALDGGFARVGTAYLTQRDRQLAFLVRFLQAWKKLAPEDGKTALTDPWAFRAVVDSVPVGSAYGQRNALLHLAYPEVFESIVSRSHKSAILAAFAGDLPAPTGDEDRDLLALRQTLEARKGGRISFYDGEHASRWRTKAVPAVASKLRGWLVRGANVDGNNLVSDWLAHGYCSIAYETLPEIGPGSSRAQLDEIVAQGHPDFTVRQRSIHVGVLDRFLNQMKPGDLVATVDGPRLYVGVVTGQPTWQEIPGGLSNRRRTVDWVRSDPPLRRDQLSEDTRDKLQGQMTVSDLGAEVVEFARLAGLDEEPVVEGGEAAEAGELTAVALPEATPELAQRLFVDLAWLNETIDLLRDKRQIVLYGPPGTGKTYLAQELALYLTEQTGGEYRLVQFHPSYAYEDFFEGFRPQEGVAAGTIAFALEPGPFKLLVKEALENPGHAYVLVIDEINRANLAKVFGELYFLLEYRDRAVMLQYSPTQEYRLPKNVFLIGTMNTADRSIALVDAAMRRRFAWQGLFPGEWPIADMLRRWLQAHHLPPDRADLLDTLNERIADRDSAIGPSYLMTESVATEEGLQRVWKHQILPLLEERHVGEGLDVATTYGLQALRSHKVPAVPVSVPEPPSEDQGEPAT